MRDIVDYQRPSNCGIMHLCCRWHSGGTLANINIIQTFVLQQIMSIFELQKFPEYVLTFCYNFLQKFACTLLVLQYSLHEYYYACFP